MNIHIALYKWKQDTNDEAIQQALREVEALANKVPGIIDITTGRNTSKYGQGYTDVILVRGKDQAAINAYRNHPDHSIVAQKIEAMESQGIGVDFNV
jgi:hypothetical protein